MRTQFTAINVHASPRFGSPWCIILIGALIAGLMHCEVRAAQVTLRWDYTATGAAGFMLYCGTSSRSYSTRVDVGNADTYTIGTLPAGATSFCAVTAYDSSKVESNYSNELSIVVPSAAPVVDFAPSPASGTAPLTVTFANTTSGQVTSWSWDFGDGTTSTAQNPSHVYSVAGNYKPVLTATGPGGTVSKTAATAISVVAPAAPVVSFTASPTSGVAPLSVVFNNTTTGQVTSWSWNFGDGTSSIVKNPTHVYSAAGSYTVTLSATGPGGTVSKTAATPINVVVTAAPVVSFTASLTSGVAPLSVVFNNTTTGQVTSWSWNFGDGTSSSVQNPTHVYSAAGSYTVTLSATGPGGTASKTGSAAISVSPTPDTTPPSVPAGLTAAAVSSSQINLAWAASSDSVGVTGYRIERCQGVGCTSFTVLVPTQTATSFSDGGLAAGTSYSYRLRATDAAGNLSGYSATASTSTQAAVDTTKPTVPTGLTGKAVSTSRIDLTWSASSDNVGISRYRVERCQGVGCTNFALVERTTGTAFSATGLTSSTRYRFRVRAVDAAGNVSGYSNVVGVTTLAQ